MTTAQTIWTVLIAALAVVNLPFLLVLLKGPPMSDAFNAALAGIIAHFTAQIAAMQTQLDAAAATTAAAVAAKDAEATAALIAAVPV